MNETSSKLAKISGWSRALMGILMALVFAGALAAQCPNSSTPFTGEAERGKPFQAVFVQATTSPSITGANVMIERKYRDSDGRVRTEVYVKATGSEPEMPRIGQEDFAGEDFAGVESTFGKAPPELRLNFIVIDDPCSLKNYFITPGAKTVKIQGRHFNQGPFCTSIPANPGAEIPGFYGPGVHQWVQTDILGFSSFAGVASRGQRTSAYASLEDKQSGHVAAFSNETWCSEELGITTASFQHQSIQKKDIKRVLRRLTRVEPDAALFEIPRDYTQFVLDSKGNFVSQPNPTAKDAPKRD